MDPLLVKNGFQSQLPGSVSPKEMRNLFKSDTRLYNQLHYQVRCNADTANEMWPAIQELGNAIVDKYKPHLKGKIKESGNKAGAAALGTVMVLGVGSLGAYIFPFFVNHFGQQLSQFMKDEFTFIVVGIQAAMLTAAAVAYGVARGIKTIGEKIFWRRLKHLESDIKAFFPDGEKT